MVGSKRPRIKDQIMEAQPMMEEEKIEGIDKYKVESDLRTIKEYASVFADPSRLKAVKSLAKTEIESLARVARGKDMSKSAEENKHSDEEHAYKMNSY
jgi:hypothetical protein